MIPDRAKVSMVIVVVLLTALIVAPTAARNTPITANGANVFIGEEDLNFTGSVFAGTTSWVHYTGEAGESPIDKTITPNPEGNISEMTRGIPTGSYYAIGSAAPDTNYINVLDIDVTLDVVLNESRKDSVNGKSVTRENELAFKLVNNLVGLPGATMNIEVTHPGGGVTTQFGGQTLLGVTADGTTLYKGSINLSNTEAGTYTAVAKWPRSTDFFGKGFDSKAVTFEVLSKALSLTANKDSVVRSNSFTVTVTGEARTPYQLFVKGADAKSPMIAPGQTAVTYGVGGLEDDWNRSVTTNAGGTATIQFNTTQNTDNRAFTIRVEEKAPGTKSDEVKVRVEAGSVTITTSGTGAYYIGEEITLSGTCTESEKVYFFMTGPNLNTDGANLTQLRAVNPADASTFESATVCADGTWSFKWNTADVVDNGRYFDAGSYTIYAVSAPVNKKGLSEARYATASILLRASFLSVLTSGANLTPGNDYQISGIATEAPDVVQIWIFGKNYYKLGTPVTVESDGTFTYTLTGAETGDLSGGQYYIVVQHPMRNGFGVHADAKTGQIYGPGINNVTLTNLPADAAVSALISALGSPNVDDTYVKRSFTVDKFWIQIDGLSDQTHGETFRIAGTTSYPPRTVLIYRITVQDSETVSLSGEVVVSNNHEWSIDLNTITIGPGAYTFCIMAIDGQASATALFDIYDDITHPIPPEGGSYWVERIDITPSRDLLAFGEEVTLCGTIRSAHWTERQGSLEFSTELENPAWSSSITRNGMVIYTQSGRAKSLTWTALELNYGYDKVQIHLILEGTVPEGAGARDPILLHILQHDADGRVIPNSECRLPLTPAGDNPPSPGNITLSRGWNFISVPRTLAAENDTAAIFAGVETGSRSVLRYDTINVTWVPFTPTDRLIPLEGFWIYSTGLATIPLNFSTDLLAPPSERTLSAGWNAIGTTGNTPATARDALYSVKGHWTTLIGFDARNQAFKTAIVNGGSGAYADSRLVYQGRGYWLHMAESGTLCAIGA